MRAAAALGLIAPQGLAIAEAAAAGAEVFTTQPQVVEAGLALDLDNKRTHAIAPLENSYLGNDAVGRLTARMKRLWLPDGKSQDAQWASSLDRLARDTGRGAALNKYQEAISAKRTGQQLAAKLGKQDCEISSGRSLIQGPQPKTRFLHSHKDRTWRGKVELVLKPLMRGSDRLGFWADVRIQPGADSEGGVDTCRPQNQNRSVHVSVSCELPSQDN